MDISNSNQIFLIKFIEKIFEKFLKGRNTIIKNQDLRYLIKYCLFTLGPFFFINILLKYSKTKENGGSRTHYQIKQMFDLLGYVIDISTNTLSMNDKKELKRIDNINNNKKFSERNADKEFFEENFLNDYNQYKAVFATITSRVKDFSTITIKNDNKDLKTLLIGIFNFFNKFSIFFKKFNYKSNEKIKSFNKTVIFITGILRKIFEKISDLKSYLDKILELEEENGK